MFLMDTNVISEVGPDVHVRNWYSGIDESHFPSRRDPRGIELARRRGDLPQADILEAWLGTVLKQFSSRILPWMASSPKGGGGFAPYDRYR